ncbi:MATE family efflux transporter [Antrihabitans sp. YC3-6]|uniref:MATE family efflux transporter n=1 Tax=Antrihabitans stalagmiti TaxID=2799499 RepID=A0A934NU12_9NOCA|nr:MATE family efflux transporter [Antrihabitans stalagmiti]MBJ8341514.1 MATE family efflux transporter [Antrihabitans stalagmiti]
MPSIEHSEAVATGAVKPRRIAELALPAFGVLVAEPVYLLFDLAVVGRLGALALAGLAVGGLILTQVSTQLTFLSYGTTARSARFHGAGDRKSAVSEGVSATWLAIGIGVTIVVVMQLLARPVTELIAGGSDIAGEAEAWLRIALFGAPLILISMAGNGWMRGVQDTMRPFRYVVVGLAVSAVLCPFLVHGLWIAPHMGLPGSAVANVIGQGIAAVFFVYALIRDGSDLRPHPAAMRAQLVLGRDLIARSLAFQACFLSAAAVAARFGAASVAAHQLVLQLWNFVALALDSLAIAAQSLIGAALGARHADAARTLAWRITRWSSVFAVVLAAGFALTNSVLPGVFTTDDDVIAQTQLAWWFFVAIVPIGGVVFALDGVLLGAGDAPFLRTATLGSAVLGFLPVIWLSLAFDWGLVGIWAGLTAFMLLRMTAVVLRTVSGKWAIPGSDIQTRATAGVGELPETK